jgi:membrane dipeptidase
MPPPPVFDGHNDVLTTPDHARFPTGRRRGHLDLPRMRAGGIRGGIFSVFTPSRGSWRNPRPVSQGRAAAHASAVAGRLIALERRGHLRIGRAIEDLDEALADDGPPLAILHFEGAEAIDPALDALELWRAAGLRSLGPVWSRPNAFGSGVPFLAPSSPDTGPGLTQAGRALIERCAELGIMVDLSHLNEAGFWDVARIAPGPLVASHSAAHRLCESSRNLTDAQLDAIGASDGLVGIVFACAFLREDFAEDPDTPIELIAAHARYVADRIGAEHVALGSDFDGTLIPDAVGNAAGLPRVLDALSAAGFGGRELAAIAHENWRRVLAAWWDH